jgi:hypothetical protein
VRPGRQIEEERQTEEDGEVARAEELEQGGPIRYLLSNRRLETCVKRGQSVPASTLTATSLRLTQHEAFDHQRESGSHQHARSPRREMVALLLAEIAQSFQSAQAQDQRQF